MQGTPQELAELAQRLQGSRGGQGNAQNRTIPDPNSIAQILQPILASALGIKGDRIPKATGGMTPESAFYSQNVVAQQWERATQLAVQSFSSAIHNAAYQINSNLNLSSSLGMSSEKFSRRLSDMASSPLGLMGAQQLMNAQGIQNFMGGSFIGAQRAAFQGRSGFADPGEFMSTQDLRGMDRMAAMASSAATALTERAYRGPDGRIGVIPDYQFTRGFKVEDIMGAMSDAAGRGRNRTMPGFTDDLATGRGMEEVGNFTAAMEQLRGLMGGGEISELMDTLGGLTSGKWATMDWGALRTQLGRMSEMARMADMSGEQMVSMVGTAQSAMRTAIGVSPMSMALSGNAGGQFGDIGAGIDMAARIALVARSRGITPSSAPEEYAQVQAQQLMLSSMGLQSRGGRAATIIEEMANQGEISGGRNNPMYQTWRTVMATGSVADRQLWTERMFNANLGGGTQEGWARVENANLVRDIRSRTGPAAEEARRNTMDMMTAGQGNEYNQRQRQFAAAALGQSIAGLTLASGQPYIVDPGRRAEIQKNIAADYFREQARNYAVNGPDYNAAMSRAQTIESVYAGQGGGAAGYMAVERAMGSMSGLKEYRGAVQDRMRTALPARMASEIFSGTPAEQTAKSAKYEQQVMARAAIQDLVGLGDPGMAAPAIAALYDMVGTNPQAALDSVRERISLMDPTGSKGYMATYEAGQATAGRTARNRLNDVQAKSASLAMLERGQAGWIVGTGKDARKVSLSGLAVQTQVQAAADVLAGKSPADQTIAQLKGLSPDLERLMGPGKYAKLVGAVQSGDVGAIASFQSELGKASGQIQRDRVGVDARYGTGDLKFGISEATDALTSKIGLEGDIMRSQEDTTDINNSWNRLSRMSVGQLAVAGAQGFASFSDLLGVDEVDPKTGKPRDEKSKDQIRASALMKQLQGSDVSTYGTKDQKKIGDRLAQLAALQGKTDRNSITLEKTAFEELQGVMKKNDEAQGKAGSDGRRTGTVEGTITLVDTRGRRVPATARFNITNR